MKKILIILVGFIILNSPCKSQITFDKYYNLHEESFIKKIFPFANKYVFIGSSYSSYFDSLQTNLYQQGHALIGRIDLNGNLIDTLYFSHPDSILDANFPFNSFDYFYAAVLDGSKNLYSMGGQVGLIANGKTRSMLKIVKTDTSGITYWDKIFPLSSDSGWVPIGVTYNELSNRIYFTGYITNPNGNAVDEFIASIDTAGNILNSFRLNEANLRLQSIITDSLQNMYVTGYDIIQFQLGITNAATYKIDKFGKIVWKYPYNLSNKLNIANGITFSADGNIVLVYCEGAPGPSIFHGNQYHILKIDTAGNQIWDKSFHYTYSDIYNTTLYQLPNSNLIHIGLYRDTIAPGPIAAMLTLFDSSGTILWDRYFYNTNGSSKALYDIQPTLDGGYIMGGDNNYGYIDTVSGFYTEQAWIVKTDSLGLLTSINNHTPDYLSKATINSPFPNPTKDEITIETFVPLEAKKAMLHLFDIRGKELLQKEINKGITRTSISLQGYALGNYLIALSVDDYAAGTKKILKVE